MRLSYSQINNFLQCPRKYYFQYIEQIPKSTNSYLVSGNAGHRALELALSKQQHENEVIALDDFLRIYREKVEERIDEVSDPENLMDMQGVVVNLLKRYHKEVLPHIEPQFIEKELWGKVDGIKFKGYIDLIDRNGVVIDHKFKGKKPAQAMVDKDLQFSAYGWLLKENDFKDYANMRMDVFVTKFKPDLWWFKTTRNDEQLEFFINIVRNVANAIEREAFFPNPTTFLCSERFCDYWEECKKECKKPKVLSSSDYLG